MDKKKIRVGVWGIGAMGACAIRELARLPETEVACGLVYSREKSGVDLGTLAGINPIGVKATSDVDSFIATHPDCVLHMARDFGDYRSDDDIIKLLRAGINVVTVLSYQYPGARPEAEERIRNAAMDGGATFFSTGINPGYMYERLVPTLTGISNGIESITMREFTNVEHLKGGAEFLRVFGFGLSPEDAQQNTMPTQVAQVYLTQGMRYLADKLDMPLERIELKSVYRPAPEDIDAPGVMSVAKGKVAAISHTWTGIVRGKPFFHINTNWFLSGTMRPAEAQSDDFWLLQIEGQPSVRVGVEVQGSFARNLKLLENNPTYGGHFTTVILAIQAVPQVIVAQPGWMVPEMPQFHWKPDMRG